MANLSDVKISFDCKRLKTTEKDVRDIDAGVLRHILFLIHLIREFETQLLQLKDWDQVHGPVHSSIGQEACAVAVMQLLSRGDLIASTHRGHHHFLAKVYNAYAGNEFDPKEEVPDALYEVTEKTLSEIMGLAPGYCRGRGGSMHLSDRYSGCIGTNAVVGGGVPCGTGAAWAQKLQGSDRVAVSFLGDGAVNQGAVHEVMNMAALWSIPVIYFIENNLYAVATHVEEATSVRDLAIRGVGYAIPSLIVDGMDPISVVSGMKIALKRAREHKGPTLIEAKTYRFKHQAQSLPGSAYGYRTKEEEDEWAKRDPDVAFARKLIDLGFITEEENGEYMDRSREIVRKAVEKTTSEGSNGTRVVRPELFPGADDLMVGIRSDQHEFRESRFSELEDFTDTSQRQMIDVIPEVIRRCMERDESAVLLGEEVGHMKGGAFMATKGIFQEYRQRVVDTPISENGMIGMSLGLAISGNRPIAEIMYPDFALTAADQLFNQVAKFRYMYGNQYDLPIIVRTRAGIGTGYGAQHSMEPAALYAQFPGWRIVAPTTPFDYVGLFNSAFLSNDPVLVIEHAALYTQTGQIPADREYLIRLGTARVSRSGNDITLIAYSGMVPKAEHAAQMLEKDGVSVEVIDLRSLDYASIDYDTIEASIRKTGRVVVLEEGSYAGGIGAQLSYEIQARFFDYLDCEIGRVSAQPIVMPVSRAAEARTLPQIEDIVRAVHVTLSSCGF